MGQTLSEPIVEKVRVALILGLLGPLGPVQLYTLELVFCSCPFFFFVVFLLPSLGNSSRVLVLPFVSYRDRMWNGDMCSGIPRPGAPRARLASACIYALDCRLPYTLLQHVYLHQVSFRLLYPQKQWLLTNSYSWVLRPRRMAKMTGSSMAFPPCKAGG